MPALEDCIFCEPDDPCHAHMAAPPKKKASKPRKAAATPVVAAPVAPAASTSDPWGAAAKASQFKAPEKAELTQDELALRELVRTLWPILAPSERKKYKDLVDPPKSAALYKESIEVRRMLDVS